MRAGMSLFCKLMRASIGSALVLSLACCSEPPLLRSQADSRIALPSNTDDPVAAQCQQLRAQIRANQESVREAPTISTSPQIVAAAQGKADQRIQALRDQLEALDCADQSQSPGARAPPLPPAPNAPNP
jgi:hypothetical protein